MPTWTTVFNDTFTVSSNTNIADHTPDTGTGWTVDNAQGNPHIDATRDMLEDDWYGTSVSNPHRSHVTDSLNDDQAVEAAIHQSNAGYRYGIIARYTHHATVLNGFDGYLLAPRFGVDTRLYRVQYNGGSPITTLLASWNSSSDRLESGDTGRIECDGTTISYIKNNTLIGSATDSVITGGSAAFVMGYLSTGMLDNFKAEHVAGAGGMTVAVPASAATGVASAFVITQATNIEIPSTAASGVARALNIAMARTVELTSSLATAVAAPFTVGGATLVTLTSSAATAVTGAFRITGSSIKRFTRALTRPLTRKLTRSPTERN